MEMNCDICNKKLKDNDWIKVDSKNKLTHCTCNSMRSNFIKDIDTFKNIINKYSIFHLVLKSKEFEIRAK